MSEVIIVWCGICLMMLVRVQFNTINRHKLNAAIYKYQRNCIKNNVKCFVDYDDRYSYFTTCFVPWHWKINKMMPEAKFKIIESYL